MRAYEERSSLRGLEWTFGVSRNSVIAWIKKSGCVYSVERDRDNTSCHHFRLNAPGMRRTLVFCCKKDEPGLDLDRFAPPDSSSGRVCHWGSQPGHLSPFVGGHSICLPYQSLLHRFLGSISGRDLRRAACGWRMRKLGKRRMLERWNKTLRQRLARFVRKTLSFSKDPVMPEALSLSILPMPQVIILS